MERLLHYKLAVELKGWWCGIESGALWMIIISLMIGRDVTETNASSVMLVLCSLDSPSLSQHVMMMLSYVFCMNVIGFTSKLRLACMRHELRCFQAIQHVQHDIEKEFSFFLFGFAHHLTWYWKFSRYSLLSSNWKVSFVNFRVDSTSAGLFVNQNICQDTQTPRDVKNESTWSSSDGILTKTVWNFFTCNGFQHVSCNNRLRKQSIFL